MQASAVAVAVAVPRLGSLPDDVLLLVCDFMPPRSLLSLSLSSATWALFCARRVWPRRIAACLGVRAVRLPSSPPCTDPAAYFRILRTLTACPSARTLCVRVRPAAADSLTALALRYAVSRHDICAANGLYAEHHVAARRHLYIPLPTDAHVRRFTGRSARALTPLLVRDHALSNKLIPVAALVASAPQP